MKKILSLNLVAVMVFLFIGLALSVQAVGAEDCEIPESGPWPPCATAGGSGMDAGMGSGATGGNAGETCQIPESGPWPPCATADNGGSAAAGGGAAASTGSGAAGASCPIPESGPWPPCATAGAGGAVSSGGGATAGGGATSGGGAAAGSGGAAQGGGAAASAPGSRTFNMQQVRSMMVAVMNETFTNNAACTGNQCFGAETNMTIANGTIRMVAFTTPSGSAADVKIDLLMRVSAENGNATITLERLTRNRIVATPANDLATMSVKASGIFDDRLSAEVGAEIFDSISADNGAMMVSYR